MSLAILATLWSGLKKVLAVTLKGVWYAALGVMAISLVALIIAYNSEQRGVPNSELDERLWVDGFRRFADYPGLLSDAMRDYLGKHPDGLHKEQALQIVKANATAAVGDPWHQKGCSKNGLKRYLEFFPDNKHREQAEARKNDYCLRAAEESERMGGDIRALESYLETFPKSSSAAWAKHSIAKRIFAQGVKNRDRGLFGKVVELSSEADYLHKEAISKVAEIDTWDASRKGNTYGDYLAYLARWKDGMFYADAVKWMRYHSSWKELPAPTKARITIEHVAAEWPTLAHDDLIDNESYGVDGLGKQCAEKRQFADLVEGFAIIERHYDAYRVFFSYGFDSGESGEAKRLAQAILKDIPISAVAVLATTAWSSVNITQKQRDAIKYFVDKALEYEEYFDLQFQTVERDALDRAWRSYRNGGKVWRELGFRQSSDPCLQLPFLSMLTWPGGSYLSPVGGPEGTIEGTLYDFWYERYRDGTKEAVSAAFKAVAALKQ